MVASSKYLPYGESRPSTGDPGTDKLFTGQRLDQSGLYFYNARYHDAQIGRFISADTVVPDRYDPQNLNRYSYVINNPLKYTDPSGHFWDWFVDAASVVADIVELCRDPSWGKVGTLAADVVMGIVPFVPAVAGMMTRAGTVGKTALSHGDDLVKLSNRAQDVVTHGDDVARLGKPASSQLHHFATVRSGTFTDRMARIAKRFDLDMAHGWNTAYLPKSIHQGRHANAYHKWVLRRMNRAANLAGDSAGEFLRHFNELVVEPVKQNPEMVRKRWWPR